MKSPNSIGRRYRRSGPKEWRERVKALRGQDIIEVKVPQPKDEMTIKDLLGDPSARFRTKERAAKIKPEYVYTDRTGTIHFRTNSGTKEGLKHYQKIQLVDLKQAIALQKRDPTLTNRDVVYLAVFGDIKVWCSDASFKYYGWQYITWEVGAGIEPEVRFPKQRNPLLSGTLCKHLYAVLKNLPKHIPEITSDLIRAGLLEPRKGYRNRGKVRGIQPDQRPNWQGTNLTK